MTFLNHITLQTGDSRRSERAEIDDGFLRQFQNIVAASESGETVEMPTPDGLWELARLRTDESRHCRQWVVMPKGDGPAAVLALAMKSRPGATVWRRMHDNPIGLATSADEMPAAPWLAVRLNQSIITRSDHAAHWLGDAERCIAWAWIESFMRADWPLPPVSAQIIAARSRAGLSQTAAAALIYRSLGAWQKWEAGTRNMDPALWELWRLKCSVV